MPAMSRVETEAMSGCERLRIEHLNSYRDEFHFTDDYTEFLDVYSVVADVRGLTVSDLVQQCMNAVRESTPLEHTSQRMGPLQIIKDFFEGLLIKTARQYLATFGTVALKQHYLKCAELPLNVFTADIALDDRYPRFKGLKQVCEDTLMLPAQLELLQTWNAPGAPRFEIHWIHEDYTAQCADYGYMPHMEHTSLVMIDRQLGVTVKLQWDSRLVNFGADSDYPALLKIEFGTLLKYMHMKHALHLSNVHMQGEWDCYMRRQRRLRDQPDSARTGS